MKKAIILLFSIFIVCPLNAAEDELFFTYVGPVLSLGMNRIAYKGWSSDLNIRERKRTTEFFYSGGLLANIYVRSFIGEFSIEYINDYSNKESMISVQHLIYTSAIKYSYPVNALLKINNPLELTGGLGIYLETPPATKSYKGGGGLNSIIGAVYTYNREWKIIFDILFRYGYFGLGDQSYKLSTGVKIGVVYKVGRI